MLFNHDQTPKTVAPIAVQDDTTTETAKKVHTEETVDETTVTSSDNEVDDTLKELLGLNEKSSMDEVSEETITE